MQTTRTGLFGILVCFAIAYPLVVPPPLNAQDDCETMYKMLADANSKLHSIPAHVYTTSKIGSQTFSAEMIYAAGSMYMKINGKWSLAGSIKDLEESEQPLRQNAKSKDSCRLVKDEQVNGEMAAVYASHSESPKGSIDMQIWISKDRGLVLRSDTNSDGGKDLISARYEYENVKPPL